MFPRLRHTVRYSCITDLAQRALRQPAFLASVGWSEFNVPFQHTYGYIRDDFLA